jgi:hypothetical protein
VAQLNRGRVSDPAQAALSGSHRKAPGSAGGYLLHILNEELNVIVCRIVSGSRGANEGEWRIWPLGGVQRDKFVVDDDHGFLLLVAELFGQPLQQSYARIQRTAGLLSLGYFETARAALSITSATSFSCRHVILEGRLRFFDDTDVEVIIDKNVVNAPPARTVRPDTVDEDDIFHFGLLSLQFWNARQGGDTQYCGEQGESSKPFSSPNNVTHLSSFSNSVSRCAWWGFA